MTVKINSNIAKFHLFVNNWILILVRPWMCVHLRATLIDVINGGWYSSIVLWRHRIAKSLSEKDIRLSILVASCGFFLCTEPLTTIPETVYDCAILFEGFANGRSPGITAVKFTTSTVASISANLKPDINLKKVNVSILGHKQQHLRSAEQKFHRSIQENILYLSDLD